MKINYTDGCTCYSLTIDGKEVSEMNSKEIQDAVAKLVYKVTDTAILQEIIERITESIGDFEDLGTCEECGDWITKYTYED